MRAFLQRSLEPADRLGEVLFGLIMALGFTGAVRLGLEEADNRALFVGILGCNIAWGIVDGVMYAIGELFERGRRARLARDVLNAPTEEAALERIEKDLGGRPVMEMATPDERSQIQRLVLTILRRDEPRRSGLKRDDVLGGLAVALVIILSTLPVVVPFLLLRNPAVAARVANLVALTELFLLGTWWGRLVGVNPWRIAAGLTIVGLVLVLVTVALGG